MLTEARQAPQSHHLLLTKLLTHFLRAGIGGEHATHDCILDPASIERCQRRCRRTALRRHAFAQQARRLVGIRGQLRGALGGDTDGWTSVSLMGGVGRVSARFFVPAAGWTSDMADVRAQIQSNVNALKTPQLGNAPLPRSVTGLEVSVGAASLHRPITRVFLVGE